MTSIAPSVAPDATPSVSGDASGLRSSAWNTTPATASPLPAIAAAMTRGRRATKKTCASTLSAYGIDRSNTRDSRIGVLPTSGANRIAAAASAPNSPTATAMRRRILGPRSRPSKRHHRQMAGARMADHVGLDSVEGSHGVHVEHLFGGPVREHSTAFQQHELRAQRRRQIQIV